MSSGPSGQICRDVFCGSLNVKGKTVLDNNRNLKVKSAVVNEQLIVNGDVTVRGNVSADNIGGGGGGDTRPAIEFIANGSSEVQLTAASAEEIFCFGSGATVDFILPDGATIDQGFKITIRTDASGTGSAGVQHFGMGTVTNVSAGDGIFFVCIDTATANTGEGWLYGTTTGGFENNF